jgi:hypothetical protein
MLFKKPTLEGLAAGTITLAFRRWQRPSVRPGGRLRTAVGVLAVDEVAVVQPSEITEDEARRAGFPSRAAQLAELDRHGDWPVYRIALHWAGPDPRIELREREIAGDEELEALRRRLTRLDAANPQGPWTRTVLGLIRDNPGTRAPDLAARLQLDTLPFKVRVRKLKELGLTESLKVGYRLSPRGEALLARLVENAAAETVLAGPG